MNQYFELLKKYSLEEKHYKIVLKHGLAVLGKSIEIIRKKDLYDKVDFGLIISGALLHDIGSFEFMRNFKNKQINYLKHGIIGGKILRKEGFKKESLIAERHIGSGLSRKYIIENNLPLPQRDFLPVSLEEKVICYADKFHSKSDKKIDNLKSIKKEMKRFGAEPLERFLKLEKMFEY